MAKPQRYTAEQVSASLKKAKGLLTLTATDLGCSLKTVQNYINRYPSVKQEYLDQKEGMLDLAEGTLYRKIRDGDLTAIIFFLKTQGKSRHYSERMEVTGADGKPITPPTITVFEAEHKTKAQDIISVPIGSRQN